MSEATIVLIMLIAYKLTLLGVGWWASRRVSNESDCFLAGGGLGAAFGPVILVKCLGVKIRDIFILAAIVVGFGLAVTA